MKKLLSVVLALTMILSLAACGSGTEADTGASAGGKKYIIATDTVFAPFEFTDDKGEFVGIDVDILAAVAADQGFEYELQSLGFDAAVASLESGQSDGVIAGMSITDARKEKYNFSAAYYDSTVAIATKADATYGSLDDFKGLVVAAKTGTQGADCAESLKDKYGFTIQYFDESSLMYQDVLTGNTVACFEDMPVMAYGVKMGNGLKVFAEQADEYSTPYGFAVLKGSNDELLAMFDQGLANIKANGTYDEILAKYTAAE